MSEVEAFSKIVEMYERTEQMVNRLSETCAKNMEMYDKHLSSLERSRDAALSNAQKALELSNELTSLMKGVREDYNAQLNALKAELHVLRDEYRAEAMEMRNDYRDLVNSYKRIAETSGSRSEVTIKR